MVVKMKWLPILRAEETHVYGKTDRGIEPAKKQYQFCNAAKQGEFALCKSEEGHLIMLDYREVEA